MRSFQPLSPRRPAVASAAAAALALLLAGPTGATEVKTFQVQSQKAFLAGTLEGVSVDPAGRLRLADRADRLASLEEPFLLAAAEHPRGWVVGTGNDGKVLLIEPGDGPEAANGATVTELFAAGEGQVFAVHADPDGTVWAGLSPGGEVYRIEPSGSADEEGGGGEATLWYETGETYVWDLARARPGDPASPLLVATGTSGKLFRVTGAGPAQVEGEELYDTGDTHLRSLLVRADGTVLLGTAGEGLIVRLEPDGTVRTLYDADQPEVVALAEGPEGGFYAAVIASEASSVDLSAAAAAARARQRTGADDEEDEDDDGTPEAPGSGGGEVEVTVGTAGAGSRPAGFQGKRSQVLRVSPAGVVEALWSFDDETVFDLLFARGRLWVATGLEGKLFSFDGERMVLEKDVDERQIVALLPDRPGPAFATTNAPALYRLAGTPERTGTYTSAALDAGRVARFGTLRWWGEAPARSTVRFSLRSGISAEPDRTWSEWTEPRAPGPGGEVVVEGLPRGRYVQWRATLEAPGRKGAGAGGPPSPTVDAVELSYRQDNLRPEIESFEAMEPGQILVPAGFNPALQVFEPVHPNREGIFVSLERSAASGDPRTKALWKKGYRTFRWKAEDPNGDELTYTLEFRPLHAGGGGGGEGGDDGWLPVAEDLDEDHFGFDATALPDGLYRFRLRASDQGENAPGEGLDARRLSEPVVIDHSPPGLVGAQRREGTTRATVADALNPLRSAEYSVDAGPWRPAPAADRLLDARREELVLEVPDGARLLLLRVTDAAHNVVTFDLSEHVR